MSVTFYLFPFYKTFNIEKLFYDILLFLKVLVAKPSGKTKVYLATDLPDPVVLHWALSKNAGEWTVRHKNLLIIINPSNVVF